MKRIFIVLAVFIVLVSVNVSAENDTYMHILSNNGYDITSVHNRYITKDEFTGVINILFNTDKDYDVGVNGHVTGLEFFKVFEQELKLDTFMIVGKEAYYNRALTFTAFFELIDFYFSEIVTNYKLEIAQGILSVSSSEYLLTYGDGNVAEFNEFLFFKAIDQMYDVTVISDNGKIVEVIPIEKDIPLSWLNNKQEIKGKIFLLYEDNIILETEKGLEKFSIINNFRILKTRGTDEVVLFTGNYKKNLCLAGIAVERMN